MKKRKLRKQRRVAIVILLFALLFNTLSVYAGTGTPQKVVKTYEELVEAIAQANEYEKILVNNLIHVPKGGVLGDGTKRVTLEFAYGCYLEGELDHNYSVTTLIQNINFSGNDITRSNALFLVRGKVNFNNCNFLQANAGAIRTAFTNCTFTGCKFNSNKNVNDGAHISASIKSYITMNDCSFTYGESSNKGGAIHLDDADSTLALNGCYIYGNRAKYGGGISCKGTLTMQNTVIYNNSATVGGADLFLLGSRDVPTVEEMAGAYHAKGIEPVKWENDYNDLEYGGTCYKMRYDAYIAPPVDPEPTDPPVDPTPKPEPQPEEPKPKPDPSKPVDPEDPKPDPVDPNKPVDPKPEPEKPTGDNITTNTDNSNHSVTDNSTTNTDNSVTDNSKTDNSTTDNSTTDNSVTDNSSVDNTDNSVSIQITDSSSSISTTDNSSSVNNTDNSKTDNSTTDNSSTVNNYYTKGSDVQPPVIHNSPQPVNVTVPVTVSAPKNQGSDPTTDVSNTKSTPKDITVKDKNINIEAKGVDVVLEMNGEDYNISIKAPEAENVNVKEKSVDSEPPIQKADVGANKASNWVNNMIMILLAVLVGLELKDKIIRTK